MTNANGPAVHAQGVSVVIKGKRILDQIDLDVEHGSFHGIIGPNGAGKTTLFEVALGFRAPTSGDVGLLGCNPIPRQESLLRRIGIQPQATAFFPRMTAREHLTAIAAIFGAPSDRVDEVISALDLDSHASTRVEKLSGGERQRLAIASALVHGPEVLFLDEPTAGLDPAARNALVLLLQSTRESKMTIIYTTHYLEEAERLCDTVSIIDAGNLLVTAAPSKLIGDANLGCSILLPAAVHQVDDLMRIPLVENVDVTSQGVLVHTRDAADAFGAFTAAQIATTGSQVHNGTLEDVFISLTGRTYQP